jgi:tripartite-type tricarboxylate transporter receptor subunit TctC
MKRVGCLGGVFLALFGYALSAASQTFPERAIRLVVPFPAGGTVDSVARTVAQRLTESLRQPVIVENRPGASGSIGSEAVARAQPDGYLLLLATASTHGTNPSVQKSLPYDPVRDFAPVALIGTTPYILVTHPSVPANSVAELLALARAQPGRLNYGSYGSGSSNHLATELFRAMTGAEIVHVAYKGGAPALTALLAGEVQVMFDVFTTAGPHLRNGKLKLLGVGASKRSSLAPEAPTLIEAGLSEFEAGTFFGIVAPASTPIAIVDRLNTETNRAVASTEVAQRLANFGTEPRTGPPQLLGQMITSEVARWAKLVRERNLRFEP